MTAHYTPLGIGVGSRIADRFEVIRRLGAGSMSVVYVVADLSLNREIAALKLLAPAMTNDPHQVDRFRNEMLLTRKLTHPNIVRTHEFGCTRDKQYFITMELVDGLSLEQMLKFSEGGLDTSEVAYYLLKACQGISYAHKNDVIHRDLKPGNVLVSKQGEVKLTDFGLARMVGGDDRMTRVGDCVGTPLYMAPEQVREGTLDARTDIYGLGIIAFELVTGTVPHSGNAWYELAEKIINDPIPDVGRLRRGVPPWLQALIKRATEKEPKNRFASIDEVIDVLQPHVEGTALPQTDLHPMAPRMRSQGRRREPVLDSMLFSIDWVRLAPRLMLVGLFVMCIVLLVGLTENRSGSLDTAIEKKTKAVGRILDTVERLNKVAVQTVENQEKLEKFLDQQEEKEAQRMVDLEEPAAPAENPPADDPNEPGTPPAPSPSEAIFQFDAPRPK